MDEDKQSYNCGAPSCEVIYQQNFGWKKPVPAVKKAWTAPKIVEVLEVDAF